MSQGNVTLTIAAMLVALTASCGRPKVRSTSASPGLEPYSPTKLEWLQLEAHTELAENGSCYNVNVTKREPDTIVVVVPYMGCMTAEGARVVAEAEAEEVRSLARQHGWNDWLKIEKDVHLLDEDDHE
jgi:hypothetical protein